MQRFTVKIAALRVTFSKKRMPPCQYVADAADQGIPAPGCVVNSKRMFIASPRSVGR